MFQFRYLALMTLLGNLLLACGNREIPAPSPSPGASSTPVNQMTTTTLRPSIETQDALLTEVRRLEQDGVLRNVSVMESYPVQIALTGPSEVIQQLQTQASGGKGNPGNVAVSFEELTTVNFRRVQAGTESVQDAASWEALWQSEGVYDSGDRPEFDFSTQTVLAVFAGEKSSGGYRIRITEVKLQDRLLQVTYQESAPASDSMVTGALTYPQHLVVIEKSQQQGDFDTVVFQRQAN